MLVRVSGIATLGWRALLARHVGSYGWSGHFVIFASASWRGVSHSGGVRGQVLITALCMLVRVSGIATLEWRALLARHVGSYGWSGHFVVFASASWRGVSHSGGVRGQVLITALCMLVRVSAMPPCPPPWSGVPCSPGTLGATVGAGTLWFLPRPPGVALVTPAASAPTLGDEGKPPDVFDPFESCSFRRILSLV